MKFRYLFMVSLTTLFCSCEKSQPPQQSERKSDDQKGRPEMQRQTETKTGGGCCSIEKPAESSVVEKSS